MLSVNRIAWQLVERLIEKAEEYGVAVKKTSSGTTLIDAGIECKGGFLAGKIVTEICLGGLGRAELSFTQYGDLRLPSIFVSTCHPAVATLGSQLAGWQLKFDDYSAIGSGPARALALKPRKIYRKIDYEDSADVAVLALETTNTPPEKVIKHISTLCGVRPDNLTIILFSTSTLTGSTQISGRVVETGVHKLVELGVDPKLITYGCGLAPIAPVHPKFSEAMGRANDAILYGGVTWYTICLEDEEQLKELIERAPSSASKDYGRPFSQIFKRAGYDFYQIDPGLFAPAILFVNNIKTGNTFRAGKINVEVLRKSMKL
jgi:methenyltetrahydromethanopterin cyclohydrolase